MIALLYSGRKLDISAFDTMAIRSLQSIADLAAIKLVGPRYFRKESGSIDHTRPPMWLYVAELPEIATLRRFFPEDQHPDIGVLEVSQDDASFRKMYSNALQLLDIPEGSVWQHADGGLYRMMCILNINTDRSGFVPTVAYESLQFGTKYGRATEVWFDRMVMVNPEELEAKEATGDLFAN